MQECNFTIQGFSGKTKITKKGGMGIKIQYDLRTAHKIIIPSMLVATKAPCHLLSPQHWGLRRTQMRHIVSSHIIIKHDKITIK